MSLKNKLKRRSIDNFCGTFSCTPLFPLGLANHRFSLSVLRTIVPLIALVFFFATMKQIQSLHFAHSVSLKRLKAKGGRIHQQPTPGQKHV